MTPVPMFAYIPLYDYYVVYTWVWTHSKKMTMKKDVNPSLSFRRLYMKLRMKDNGHVSEWKETWYLRTDYPPYVDGVKMDNEKAELRRQGAADGLLAEHKVKGWKKQRQPVFRAI